MPNIYQARLSDGRTYDVPTDRHHSDYDDNSFKKHLLDILKNSASGVISGVIVGFVLKGRK